MKDLFSQQAEAYRKHRPVYPQALYDYILQEVKEREAAWDCGTGNGQVAAALAGYFQEIEATDISENQLKNAEEKANVFYQLCQAESTYFDEDTFDLITVAQAIHWFDFESFYTEVRRVAKPGAVIAIWGYGLFRINPQIDALVDDFYTNVTGPYWEHERTYIDEQYKTIPFPFNEIKVAEHFSIEKEWSLDELRGFLNTWSSVQKYIKQKGKNPVDGFIESLKPLWPEEASYTAVFPIFLRMGRV